MEQPVEISQNEYEEPQSPSDVSQPTEKDMESSMKSDESEGEVVDSSDEAKPEDVVSNEITSVDLNQIPVDAVSDDGSKAVAADKDEGDEDKQAEKRAKCIEDGGAGGSEPSVKTVPKPNFKFKLLGVEIHCYKEEDPKGPKDGADGAGGSGGCGSSGCANDGEPPAPQP